MIKKYNYINILIWILIIVCPFLMQEVGVITTSDWRIDKDNGYLSILTGPFLHASFSHMLGNLIGALIGISIVHGFYNKMYWPVIIMGTLVPAITMFSIDRPCIGISGLVYTLIWFIVIRGLMSRDTKRFFIGLVMAIMYRESINGTFPSGDFDMIAWQAHLAGLLSAFVLAIYSRIRR